MPKLQREPWEKYRSPRSWHPAARLFPLMEGKPFRELTESIKRNGLLNPIVLHEGRLLDGRNRLRACLAAGVAPRAVEWQPTGDLGPTAWVLAQNLERRHLTSGQRACVGNEAMPLIAQETRAKQRAQGSHGQEGGRGRKKNPSPKRRLRVSAGDGKASAQAAKAAHTSRASVEQAQWLQRTAPDLYARVKSGTLTQHKAVKTAKTRLKRAAEEAAKQQVSAQDFAAVADCRVAGMETLLLDTRDLDAIITDPPYGESHLPAYAILARLAKDALTPQGVLAVLTGQFFLPAALAAMREHLPYRWTMAYLTPGGQAVQAWDRKVTTFWKPVLLFGGKPKWLTDVVASAVNDNDKRYHGWGQSESGMAALVERLTEPGQTICDPMMGAGTTGVAAVSRGRRFVGGDLDAAAVETARGRIAAVLQVLREGRG